MRDLFKKLSILLFVLCTVLVSSAYAVTGTYSVTASTDDHEEKKVNDNKYESHNGTNSTDLDMGKDGGKKILIGLRFSNVTIPQGATINSAVLRFTAGASESHSNPQTAEVKLKIKGEKSPTPATFSTADNDIYNRWDKKETDKDTTWTISSDWTDNTQYDSVDIKDIVQEIVKINDWASGNYMVIMLRHDDKDAKRLAYSYDGSSAKAPQLVVDYTDSGTSGGTCETSVRINAASDDADDNEYAQLYNNTLRFGDKYIGLRFNGIAIAPGSSIKFAELRVVKGQAPDEFDNKEDKAKVKVRGQKSPNASTFTTTKDDIKDRPKTSQKVDWKERNDVTKSPDISKVIQEIVGQTEWLSGNSLVLFLEDDKGRRPLLAYDDDSAKAAELYIEYACGSGGTVVPDPQPTIQLDVASSTEVYLGVSVLEANDAPSDTLTVTNSGAADLNYTITGLPAWLSLSQETGTLAKGASQDITVTYTSNDKAVGTYQATLTVSDPNATEPEITVPVSMTIYSLPIGASSCSNVPLYVQNRVSPAVLVNLDLSGSMRTMMPVSQTADLPKTPDLKTIFQEIVNRPGWDSSNDMVFIVSGSGSRRAWSYDGQNSSAPVLTVSYTNAEGVSSTISKRISDRRDDAEQKSNGTSFSDSKSELNLGSRVIGLRFQGLNIPSGATIDSASIEFTISSPDSTSTSLTFYGQAIDDAPRFSTTTGEMVTDRTRTTSSVSWANVPEWSAPTEQSRLTIAQNVISEIFKNRNINWGFGTWTGNYSSSIDYTKIEVGCKLNTDEQQTALQSAIKATQQGGYTPFVPSMDAAGKYFAGTKNDLDGGKFANLSCQDKFLIQMTDGLGNIPSNTNATAASNQTATLADAGISTVAVGFGIDNATMINAVAVKANEKGSVSETDNLYALHDDTNGDGVADPFLAMNQEELLNSLLAISHKIENRFTGSAPAPTTSADDDDLLMVLIAEFGSASWTGDLRAMGYSLLTNDWTTELWVASDHVPATRNVWTYDTSNNARQEYADSSFYTAKTLCKNIGDIINSAPVIVKWPNSFYSFDSYSTFYNNQKDRKKMVYVGANDGQLHAFLLTDADSIDAGTEMWSFIPPSLLPKLKQADSDPTFDLCDSAYCHQYYVDGSPKAADIFAASAWHTILVTGLREGGDSYFALDVTDGETMSSSTTTGAQFLWEFTDSELGQTWGDAQITRVQDSSAENAKAWAAYFGSGYSTAGAANNSAKESYLYGINAYDKSNLWTVGGASTNRVKVSTSTLTDDALAELLTVDKDSDTDFMDDFIYFGNLRGDFFRVKDIGKGQSPVISTLYESNNSTNSSPIRARASYANGKLNGEFWLYFGTGRYELIADKSTNAPQYFFGLKEVPDNGDYTRAYVKPATLDSATVDPAITNRLDAHGSPADLKLVALKSTEYTATFGENSKVVRVIEGQNENLEPWVIRLGTSSTYSERVITQPLVVAGVVFFTSFVPDNDACAGSGSSYLYAVDFQTGKAPLYPVFDLNGDQVFNDDDKIKIGDDFVPVAGIKIGPGLATSPIIVGDKIFFTTTNPGDETGGGGNQDPPPIPVNLEDQKASMESWLDRSFE